MSRLNLKNDLKEVPRADAWLLRECARREIPESSVHDLRLALDEIVSNVIRHGYAAGENGAIEILADFEADRVRLEVRDAAKPFNPLLVPEPDLNIPIERRSRGGLGIFLVRKLMDRVD
jgi:anti-sigma regulatory factor (Ser/Thr protein kinase)